MGARGSYGRKQNPTTATTTTTTTTTPATATTTTTQKITCGPGGNPKGSSSGNEPAPRLHRACYSYTNCPTKSTLQLSGCKSEISMGVGWLGGPHGISTSSGKPCSKVKRQDECSQYGFLCASQDDGDELP